MVEAIIIIIIIVIVIVIILKISGMTIEELKKELNVMIKQKRAQIAQKVHPCGYIWFRWHHT